MSEEEKKETIKTLQSNPLVKCGSYEFIGDSNITYAEIYILLELIRSQEQENKQYKEVIEEVREYVEKYITEDSEYPSYMEMTQEKYSELVQILDKVKGE